MLNAKDGKSSRKVQKMKTKKNIIAALLSLSILGTTIGVCGATEPTEYTDTVDMDVCYTGAIIDCRGLGLSTAMSPVIEDTAGHKIYGTKNLDYDKIVTRGMAGYASSFSDEKALARAGSHPVVLKAVGVTNHCMYPVIDQADATLLLCSTAKNNYLRNAAVVFIR